MHINEDWYNKIFDKYNKEMAERTTTADPFEFAGKGYDTYSKILINVGTAIKYSQAISSILVTSYPINTYKPKLNGKERDIYISNMKLTRSYLQKIKEEVDNSLENIRLYLGECESGQ